jgi:hypothetical protein
MSEIAPTQNNNQEERPLGRFLLSLETVEGKRDIYTYASQFAGDYDDILNKKWKAAKVSVEEINGQRVELEFAKDLVGQGSYTWRLYAGNEQYDIDSSQDDEPYGTYYELTSQRSILRKHKIGSAAVLNSLQSVIEHMTDTRNFHKNASYIRGDSTRTHVNIEELKNKKSLTHGEDKNLKALQGHLFLAGFPVGSIDIRDKLPLID